VRSTPVCGTYIQWIRRRRQQLSTIKKSLQRWTRDKSLSFVPPDGRFTLAEYRYAPNTSATSARLAGPLTIAASAVPVANTIKDIIALPFMLKPSVELEDHGGTYNLKYFMRRADTDVPFLIGAFDVTLTSRLTTRPIENFVAEMHLGEGAGGMKCIVTQGSGAGRFGRGASGLDSGPVGVVGASWSFDSNKKVCVRHRTLYWCSHHISFRYCDGRSPPSLPRAAGICVDRSPLLRK
jgi:AP-3 complex subunit mu